MFKMTVRRALALTVFLIMLACDSGPAAPAEGESCTTPGRFYTHTNGDKSVTLVCGDDHVWHKS